jgi:hypothetical protein
MIATMLNLRGVKIRRITETSDGYGSTTTATVITTLSRASIWQPGAGTQYISDKMARVSSHVLAMLPDEYTFTDNDREVIYGGQTYKITGHDDDVANRSKIKIIGLERIS